MNRSFISTNSAPGAIGPYSQAVKVGTTTYLSGQIALDPKSMKLKNQNILEEATQVFHNLEEVCKASGGSLSQLVRITIYLVNMEDFPEVNKVMEEIFVSPFPARVTVGVAALPRAAKVEVDGVLVV
tara:strand:+ start:703 stop:1083 length:381 start_codon:yes stop_codon:yes gene_type:complete